MLAALQFLLSLVPSIYCFFWKVPPCRFCSVRNGDRGCFPICRPLLFEGDEFARIMRVVRCQFKQKTYWLVDKSLEYRSIEAGGSSVMKFVGLFANVCHVSACWRWMKKLNNIPWLAQSSELDRWSSSRDAEWSRFIRVEDISWKYHWCLGTLDMISSSHLVTFHCANT